MIRRYTDYVQNTPTMCQALCQALGMKPLRQAQAPKGQKTDKQVITTQCDETDSPARPRQLNSVAGDLGGRAGRPLTVSLLVLWAGAM